MIILKEKQLFHMKYLKIKIFIYMKLGIILLVIIILLIVFQG